MKEHFMQITKSLSETNSACCGQRFRRIELQAVVIPVQRLGNSREVLRKNGTATLAQAVPVRETFEGSTVWNALFMSSI
jgi:hypothetical protein